MTLTRRYDGEPIVRVELDTSVELDVSVNGSCGETVGADVKATAYIEDIKYCPFCGDELIEDNQYGGTCRNVYPNNEDHHCDNGFRCSACGDTVEDCENYRVSGTWNYCPKCGAKVVG